MQLTASESNQLDWYIDDENRPVEAIKLIDEYLSSLTASEWKRYNYTILS